MNDTDMTSDQQRLADDKMRAEIAKLISETKKIDIETFWYPMLIATGMFGATATILTVIFKLIGA